MIHNFADCIKSEGDKPCRDCLYHALYSVGAPLDMWVVYDHPSDYPDKWVVRKWSVTSQEVPTGVVFVGDSFEEVSNILPAGLVWMPRGEGDDPAIAGVWF